MPRNGTSDAKKKQLLGYLIVRFSPPGPSFHSRACKRGTRLRGSYWRHELKTRASVVRLCDINAYYNEGTLYKSEIQALHQKTDINKRAKTHRLSNQNNKFPNPGF